MEHLRVIPLQTKGLHQTVPTDDYKVWLTNHFSVFVTLSLDICVFIDGNTHVFTAMSSIDIVPVLNYMYSTLT
jgi:hypothetical protein